MTDETEDCEISLKLSKKSISSYVCTLNIPNFFTLPKYDHNDRDFLINSPSFEFSAATWRFQFVSRKRKNWSGNLITICSVYIERTYSEFNEHLLFIKTVLLDSNDEKYGDFCDSVIISENGEPYYVEELKNDDPSCDRRDTLTLIIYLADLQSFIEDTDQVFTVDRRNETLSHDYKKLFRNGRKHDLILRVADKEFPVHQDILMARSQVFEAMLTYDMIEKNKGIIDVPDCDPQAMEQFLHYVYCGKVELLNQGNVFVLYYLADKYSMKLLKEECSTFLKQSISLSIICDVIQLALTHSDSDLLECATKYFVNHLNEILPTVEWISFMKSNVVAANELFIKATKKWDCTKS